MAAKKKATKQNKKVADNPAPKKKKSPPSKSDVLRALMGGFNKINEKTGEKHTILAFASEVPNTYEIRRPSGIMALDIDTGGGVPAGGLTCLSGPEGSGKTYLMLCHMAMHQKLYKENSYIGFAGTETQFDFKWALNCGLKIRVPKELVAQWREEKFQRQMPDYSKEELAAFNEQIGEFMLIGGTTGEEKLEAILECHKRKIFGIIGLDSINGLLPAANAEKELSDNDKMAAQATLMTRFLNRYIPTTCGFDDPNQTTLIFIQQVRANMAKASAPAHIAKYLKDWAVAGGRATRHFKLVDVIVWSGGEIKKQVADKKITVGKIVHWELEKGKAGTHDNKTGSAGFYYGKGIDGIESVIVTGTSLGVIRETERGVNIYRPETQEKLDLGPIPNVTALYKMMSVDLNFEFLIRREVLAAAGVQCLYQ
jgi:RecA/RadA recombinase